MFRSSEASRRQPPFLLTAAFHYDPDVLQLTSNPLGLSRLTDSGEVRHT